MIIDLYINNSDNIVVHKNLIYVNTLNGNFRNPTSLKNPSIEIESSSLDFDAYIDVSYIDDNIEYDVESNVGDVTAKYSTNLFNINYIYIRDFNRYYYVTDTIIYNNKLFIFELTEDVLYTFKDSYLNKIALVSRNQYAYDEYIEDDKMTYAFKVNSNEYVLSGGDTIFNNTDLASALYVISVFNNEDISQGRNESSPQLPLPIIKFQNAGVNNFKHLYAMTWADVNILAKWVISNESESTFIISLIAFPMELEQSGLYGNLKVGSSEISGCTRYNLSNVISPYYKLAEFNFNQYQLNSYLDMEPYSTYQLYLAYYGYIDLKSSDVLNSKIGIYYSIDYSNGTCKINVLNETKNYIIKSVTGNIGVKIAINRTNNQQLDDEKTQLAIKSTISGLTSLASIGVGVFTENPFLVASGITGLSSTAMDVGTKLMTMHEKASTSNNTGYEGLYSPQECRLKITRYEKKEPNAYASNYGRPFNNSIRLNRLNGYTLIQNIYLDDIQATKDEKDELKSLLTSGIIL